MLVLTRKLGERILVGSNVEVVVLKLSRSHVQLGVKAPDSVKVLRGELVLPAPGKRSGATQRFDVVTPPGFLQRRCYD